MSAVCAEVVSHVPAQDGDEPAFLFTFASFDDVFGGIDEEALIVFNDMLPLHSVRLADAQAGYSLQEGA